MATRTRAALEAEGVRILRAIKALGDDDNDRRRRTVLLRELAEVLVDLREHFLTDAGEPDWGARTWRYREVLRELYSRAGYTHEEAASQQATVRYHTGNVLRERLSEEELADLGLMKPPPRERMRVAYEIRSSLIRALKDGSDPDVTRTIAAALILLERVDDQRVADLKGAERRTTMSTLRKIAARAEQLRKL